MALLFAGRAVLYPWVTNPVAVKAPWLNVPFFFGAIWAWPWCCHLFAFAGALLRGAVPPATSGIRPRRNRLAVAVLMLWLVTVSLWGFDFVMALDPSGTAGCSVATSR